MKRKNSKWLAYLLAMSMTVSALAPAEMVFAESQESVAAEAEVSGKAETSGKTEAKTEAPEKKEVKTEAVKTEAQKEEPVKAEEQKTDEGKTSEERKNEAGKPDESKADAETLTSESDGEEEDPADETETGERSDEEEASVSEAAEAEVTDAPESEEEAAAEQNEKEKDTEKRTVRRATAAGPISFDNSTSLSDGTYSVSELGWSFTGGSGKATMNIVSLTISGGKATAALSASSANMTHVYLGTVSGDGEVTGLYDPDTNVCGTNVIPIEGKAVTIPVRVNETLSLAVRTTAMSNPHWVQYSYTITLEEKTDDPEEETVDADYSKVEAALAKIPEDLSKYTEESVKAVNDAKEAVEYGLKANAQDKVDAMAKAIEDAVAALEEAPDDSRIPLEVTNSTKMFSVSSAALITSEEDVILELTMGSASFAKAYVGRTAEAEAAGSTIALEDGNIFRVPVKALLNKAFVMSFYSASKEKWTSERQLTIHDTAKTLAIDAALEVEAPKELQITNNTGMFKVVSAHVENTAGKKELVIVLSGTSYHDLFKGTYEEAVANGNNRDNWIHGTVNADGQWEFRVPVEAGETYVACVAISNTYVVKYENGENSLERAFYPRQFSLNESEGTLVTGDYEYTRDLTVTNNVKMFKVAGASVETLGGPNSNNYKAALVLTMGSDSYDQAYVGTAAEAEAAESTIALESGNVFRIPVKWLETFGQPETLKTLIGKPVTLSFRSASKGTWYERVLTIDETAGTLLIDPVPEEPADYSAVDAALEKIPSDLSGYTDETAKAVTDAKDAVVRNLDKSKQSEVDAMAEAIEAAVKALKKKSSSSDKDGKKDDKTYSPTTGGSTSAVDSSTALADGTYAPDSFSFSGGTGKLGISCSKITVRGGKAYATIVFSSGKIIYVKAGGGKYSPIAQSSSSSTYEIPVRLNANNQILACTTAMSQPHEVGYSLYIGLEAAKAADSKKAEGTTLKNENGDTLVILKDDPKIPSLEYEGTLQTEEAKYFRLHYYKDNFRILEISLAKDEEPVWEAEKTVENSEAEASEEDGQSASPYGQNVLRYLIAPAEAELPAGIEKDMIVIRTPVSSSYIGSTDALRFVDALEAAKQITSIGGTAGNAELPKSIQERISAGELRNAGASDELDYKALVLAKTDLAVLSGEILKEDGAVSEETTGRLQEIGDELTLLKIPMMIDRSSEEASELGKQEWIKVYGTIFGKEKAASDLLAAFSITPH